MAASQQQIMVAETIRAMKLAMKRRASDSESDGDIRQHTNRGNKLRRGAKNVQEDRLDDTGGLSYRKKVNHAGYLRHTIAANPAYLDEDGDPYSPTSSDHENERYGELADDNPFGEVQLESLLRPLTSAAELANHPSLSIPYKSKGLTQMAEEACAMLRRERASLWKAKRLLQRFRGDADWVPSQTFEAESDNALLTGEDVVPDMLADHQVFTLEPAAAAEAVDQMDPVKPFARANGDTENASETIEGVETHDMAADTTDATGADAQREVSDQVPSQAANGDFPMTSDVLPAEMHDQTESIPNPTVANIADGEAASETASQSNGTERHAMTTRARARSPAGRSDRTSSPSPSKSASVPAIHPWFVAPASSLPDRDLGLPAQEAEETRKLLLLYVQKQEQVVRSLDTLHAGLQRADRLRSYVYRSCKAEGHVIHDGKGNAVTEMSDGEDWYDVTDWGLQSWELKDGKLEKGKDEVEDVEEERGRRPGRGRRVNRI
ncbi:hypothetical protein CBER1_08786 [Cercospora berteroae]|uniref:Transcriptional regulatory protein RXT2 N-terminal domain-containing protein n=1 Tax=Cercospora berteroae TaxID=357750 RepID=A0A2S6BW06_9PEZI|nr:hypothetical protein CBER1_08786 [Cercospora berteroae]